MTFNVYIFNKIKNFLFSNFKTKKLNYFYLKINIKFNQYEKDEAIIKTKEI